MKWGSIFILSIFAVTSAFAYKVKKGDSLSAIAKEHFGTWNKWPELWKWNEEQIRNPNLIFPGQVFTIDDSIPGKKRLLLAGNNKDFDAIHSKMRSQEWRLLPEQPWERFVFKVAPEVDRDGFDRRSKVAKRIAEKTNTTLTVASDRLPIEGEIVNARTEYEYIFLGEQVFIRADEQLQVGKIYSISSGPQKIVSNRDHRVGFAYDLSGKLKIIGVRDGLFIGTVISAQKPILRNSLLIADVPQLHFKKAVPSPNIIAASVLTTEFLNSTFLAEQQLVILDVGSNEGVKPGMIFRHYMKEDPNTGETITTKDYLIESELEVLDVKDQFSTAIILQSRSTLHPNDIVLSLMDLKDFQKNAGMQTFIQDYDYSTTLDDLDQMDDSQGLGEKENNELRQLEKVDPNEYKNTELGEEPAPNDQVDGAEQPAKDSPPATAPEDVAPDTSPLEPPQEPAPAPDTSKAPPPSDQDLDAPAASSDGAVMDAPVQPNAEIPGDLSIPADVPVETTAPAAPATSPSPTPAPKRK